MTELASTHQDVPRTKWSRLAVRVVSVLGAVALVAAAYRLGGGAHSLVAGSVFVLWGLLPFVMAALVIGRATVGILRTVGLILTSGFGLTVYAQLCVSRELSSTAGLLFIF